VTSDASLEVRWYCSWDYSSPFSCSTLQKAKEKKKNHISSSTPQNLEKGPDWCTSRFVTQTTEDCIESYSNLLPPTPNMQRKKDTL